MSTDSMNILFTPNESEKEKIETIKKYYHCNYALIRTTKTMLDKSIIDASYEYRDLLKDQNILDYIDINSGTNNKVLLNGKILDGNELKDCKISCYKATTRSDPRFCIYGLKKIVPEGTLLFITTLDDQVTIIPLDLSNQSFDQLIESIFNDISLTQKAEDQEIFNQLKELLGDIIGSSWFESTNPEGKKNPKDSGETFENLLGISPNSDQEADFLGKIELKTKLTSSRTNDTLFSCVPDWDMSVIQSSKDMILNCGYPSNKDKYKGYIDLYVTVSNTPNPQGLYLSVDRNNEQVKQFQVVGDKKKELCVWSFDKLKEKLLKKHPKTAWVSTNHKVENGINKFQYDGVTMTEAPIFSEFLQLIESGEITYDWRGRVRENGTGYNDKGHAFRLKPGSRNKLFSELNELVF